GSGETRLTNNTFSVANEHPDWSPDGLKIVFSSTRDNGEQEIYTMNADGTGQTRLTNDPVKDEHPSWGRYVAAPTPTPTPTPIPTPTPTATPTPAPLGGNIVFVSRRDGNDEIYTANADGSGVTRLTTSPARDYEP